MLPRGRHAYDAEIVERELVRIEPGGAQPLEIGEHGRHLLGREDLLVDTVRPRALDELFTRIALHVHLDANVEPLDAGPSSAHQRGQGRRTIDRDAPEYRAESSRSRRLTRGR